MGKHFSLKLKLQSLLFTTSLIAFALFGLEAHQRKQALRAGKEAQTRLAAESIIDKIDRNLFERYGDVQAYAMSESARSGNPERIMDFMADMAAAYAPIYDLMVVTNARGRVIAASRTDKAGKPIDTSFMIGKDLSSRAWFKASVSGEIKPGLSHVEDLHVDEDVARATGTSGRVMTFTSPIRDKATGRVLGVWSNQMSWGDVVESLVREESEKVKGERIPVVLSYLQDATGAYLLHPRGQNAEVKAEPRPDGAAPLTASVIGERMLHEATLEGPAVEVISPSKGYGSYPSRGWTFTLHTPVSDGTATWATWLDQWLIVIAFFIILVANIIGYRVINGVARLLERAISDLEAEASRVDATAARLSTTAGSLSQAATQQTQALQSTVSALEQTTAMVKRSSSNAELSRQSAASSHEAANGGKKLMDDMLNSISLIDRSNADIMLETERSNKEIGAIVQLIAEIDSKTKIINDIVFQTKLLSFNASVEAARAGEHGKGFAVVAEEVGNLAQMSGSSAKDISEMLETSSQKVKEIVATTSSRVEKLVSDAKAKVEAGRMIASKCDQSLDQIVKNVGEVRVMVDEISSASNEQTQGIEEINKAMGQMDQATHSNASTAVESADFAKEISNQAGALLRVVGMLTRAVRGGEASADEQHHQQEQEQKPVTDSKPAARAA